MANSFTEMMEASDHEAAEFWNKFPRSLALLTDITGGHGLTYELIAVIAARPFKRRGAQSCTALL